MSTFVYNCGAKPPIEGVDLIAQQISLAHKYYNRLIELHREEQAAIATTRALLCPELEQAEAAASAAEDAVESYVEMIRHANAIAKRKRATPEELANLSALKEQRALAWADVKATKAHVKDDPVINAALESVYAEYHGVKETPEDLYKRGGKRKEARASCGVCFGTYLQIEAAVESAVKDGTAKFRRWTGDGAVWVQMQGGMTAKELFAGDDTKLRLSAPVRRGVSEKTRRVPVSILSLRVGSGPKREPIFARIPVYFHRPFPDGTVIKWSRIGRQQIAVRRNSAGEWVPYYEWSVQFTIEAERVVERATSGTCGIDLGWRLRDDGSLRVAYTVGSDGRNEEFCLPASLLGRFRQSENLQSIRDDHFNNAISAISAFVKSQALCARARSCNSDQDEIANPVHGGETVQPRGKIDGEWLMEAADHVWAWKKKGRLASLLRKWESARFPGDEAIVATLRDWQARDAHLWQYQRANSIKAIAIRKRMYETFAANIRRTYLQISVEDCDWRKLAALPDVSDNSPLNITARWHQRIASVGLLRRCLVASGGMMGKAENTTRECHKCHHVNAWKDQTPLVLTCESCGLEMDQDENAARNLAASGNVVESKAVPVSTEGTDSPAVTSACQNGTARTAEDATAKDVAASGKFGGGRWGHRKAERSRKEAQGVTE